MTREVPDGPADDPRQLEMVDDGEGVFRVHDPGPTSRDEIRRLRELGYSYHQIATSLNTRGWRSPRGAMWSATTVQHHLDPAAWAAQQREYRRRKSTRLEG